MAKAEKITPKPVETTVVLTLSEEEAKVVRDVVGTSMGSSSMGSRAKYSGAIFRALVSAVGSNSDSPRDFTGNIQFASPKGS